MSVRRRPSSSHNSKIFSSGIAWLIKAKLNVEHPQEGGNERLYKWSSSFEGENLMEMGKWSEVCDSERIWTLGAGLSPPRGYIYVYCHNVQSSSTLKLLGQSKPKF